MAEARLVTNGALSKKKTKTFERLSWLRRGSDKIYQYTEHLKLPFQPMRKGRERERPNPLPFELVQQKQK